MRQRWEAVTRGWDGSHGWRQTLRRLVQLHPRPGAERGFSFDELAKDLACGLSRRQALARLGGGLAGALLASMGLDHAGATPGVPGTGGSSSNEPISAIESIVGDGSEANINVGQCVTLDLKVQFAGSNAYIDETTSPFTTFSTNPPRGTFPSKNVFCATEADRNQEFPVYGIYCDPSTRLCVTGTVHIHVNPVNEGCAQWCIDNFPPGSERDACNSDAAHGTGPCYTCGPAAPPGHPALCAGPASSPTCCPTTAPTCCNGVCTDLTRDSSHCGQCMNACPAGSSCVNGRCTSGCPSPQVICNGKCVDTTSDPGNCGGCNMPCGSATPHCVSSHCVQCRTAADCAAPASGSATCTSGQCGIACNTGLTICSGVCVNEQTDVKNCGACGKACPTPANGSATCTSGQCGVACNAGLTICSGACVNEQTDSMNCGACGHACTTGTTCVSGACSTTCPAGQIACNGICTNTQSDRNNCGKCGTVCPAGQVCTNGACGACTMDSQCGSGLKCCSGLCVNESTNPNDCGACGSTCSATFICQSGSCACPMGTTSIGCGLPFGGCSPSSRCCPSSADLNCDTYCTNGNSDQFNCGGCTRFCQYGTVCQSGSCVCPTGTTSTPCDSPFGGCFPSSICCPSSANLYCATYCTNGNSDQLNCGGCARTCAAGQICQNGSCVAAAAGSCPGNLTAQNGQCGCPSGTVYAGFNTCCSTSTPSLCGGTCVNTQSDHNNCGGCGAVCPGDLVCQSGKCACPSGTVYAGFNRCCPMGETLCGGTCVNLQSDNNNCHGCGYACPSGTSCVNGACM